MVAMFMKKDHAQYDLCDSGVYSREMINMFLVSHVSGLVEMLTFGFSHTVSVIKVKLCMVVLLIGLYLFIPPSVTVTIFQGHRNLEQF